MPPSLVHQTCNEITQFSTNLEVWEYWGDSRARIAAGQQAIDGILTKQHAIFDNEQEETCCRIVVTSHQTLMTRHGPSELRAFRRDTKFWSDKQCRALDAIPDRQWERDLFQKFDIVWVDEAHVVKRADAYTSIVIQWLDANFTGLSTATPGINRIEDFKGLLKFVKLRNNDAWSAANLAQWGVTHDINPYTLPKEHPAAILRVTERAANKLIFGNLDEIEAGYFLAKLQEMCMIRRTYSSKIDGVCIGAALPGLVRRHMDLEFSQHDQLVYERCAQSPLKHLITPLEDGRIAWLRACCGPCVRGHHAILEVARQHALRVAADRAPLQQW